MLREKRLRLLTLGELALVDHSGSSDESLATRPRKLALLVVLSLAQRPVTRDSLVAMFWGEQDESRARHSLSDALSHLRRVLGPDAIAATGASVSLAADVPIDVDVLELERAANARDHPSVTRLYRGAFLESVHVGGSESFERWAGRERQRIESLFLHSTGAHCEILAKTGRWEECASLATRWLDVAPTSADAALHLLNALSAPGTREAALRALAEYDRLARRLADDFVLAPETRVTELAERIQEQAHQTLETRVAPQPVQQQITVAASPPTVSSAPRRRWATGAAVSLAAGIATIAIIAVLAGRSLARDDSLRPPVLAVGRIRDLVARDSAVPGAVLSEMLATSLGRLGDLQVVANSRMVELTPRDADTSRSAVTDAARRAGAAEIIEGELIPLPNRQFRLEIRRVDIRRGVVRGGYHVTGSDPFALFDSVTALIAADFRVRRPVGSLAEVSTRSLIAYRLYEEGLRAFYQFDQAAANRLFRAASREDSTFAMAAYYAWRSEMGIQGPDQDALAERAVALASRASPRDRLVIVTHVGYTRGDPIAAAETLATKYPNDPEALMRAGEMIPDLTRSAELLNRSIALDSAAGIDAATICRLCDALMLLVIHYDWVDSSDAVDRTIRRWQALRPKDATPWVVLADHLISAGRRADADAALRRYDALGGAQRDSRAASLVRNIRLDDFAAANAQCDDGLMTADPQEFLNYRWYCTIALRMQGRYREAVALIREGRVPRSRVVHSGLALDLFNSAILDMEMGSPLAAVDGFLAIERQRSRERIPEGVRARNTTWLLALAATAAVAGGDTTRALEMVDSIQRVGSRSTFPRDSRLHHFVRGLLLSRAQRHGDAAREFRNAIYSPTNGYTRVNYELGKSLLAINRPADGINVVRAALHGGIEGSGLYITRTELHELLAQLFDKTGQRDSAAVHFAVVERAWRAADPAFLPRHEAARQWLARAGRPELSRNRPLPD